MAEAPRQAETAVECSGLAVTFGKRAILHDVRLRVGTGTIVALVGPVGAGKTTLLKAMAGLVPASAGSVRICGEAVSGGAPQTRRKVGFAPAEERSFYWRLSGRENLRFFASLHGLRGPARDHRIGNLLRELGLAEREGTRFQEYSSGMRQALGLARAMLHEPAVLLLDEPTRSLSPDVAKRVQRLLVRKAREEGVTVVLASHNLREVEEVAGQITVMGRGRVLATGSLEELARAAGAASPADLGTVFDRLTGG